MKLLLPVLFFLCFTTCSEDTPTETPAIISSTFTPLNHADQNESLAILYLQEQILESWTAGSKGNFSLSMSTKIKTTHSLPLGRYTISKKADHWQFSPSDSIYPFTSTKLIMIHPEKKIGFYFPKDNQDETILSHIHQLYIIPSGLDQKGHFTPPFAAGPQQVSQYQYLEKELKFLTAKQPVHE